MFECKDSKKQFFLFDTNRNIFRYLLFSLPMYVFAAWMTPICPESQTENQSMFSTSTLLERKKQKNLRISAQRSSRKKEKIFFTQHWTHLPWFVALSFPFVNIYQLQSYYFLFLLISRRRGVCSRCVTVTSSSFSFPLVPVEWYH